MQYLHRKKRFGMGVLMAVFIAASTQEMVLSNEAPAVSSTSAIESGQLEEVELSTHIAAQELFHRAYTAYAKARPMTGVQGSEHYAEAISAIARAVALEPGNPDYLILASQIYRGKGGISSAKDYFFRGKAVLEERLSRYPDSIGANLDYAILCYAGDVRYWPDYDAYRKRAREHAEKVIILYGERSFSAEADGNLCVPLAISYLIRGDGSRCEKLLASARSPAGKFYHELYKDTVKKKEWMWPTKDAGKEFMLYYMTDPSRNGFLYTSVLPRSYPQ